MKNTPLNIVAKIFCPVVHRLQIFTLCGALIIGLAACGAQGTSSGGNAGGIGGTGIHGELNAGTTVNPLDPTNVNIGVGGKIYFAKRPLTPAEKKEIHDISYRAGIDYMKSGAAQSAEPQIKANLLRRLAYKYRVKASLLKPLAEAGFEQGAHDSGEGFVPPQTRESPDRIFRENALKALHL